MDEDECGERPVARGGVDADGDAAVGARRLEHLDTGDHGSERRRGGVAASPRLDGRLLLVGGRVGALYRFEEGYDLRVEGHVLLLRRGACFMAAAISFRASMPMSMACHMVTKPWGTPG